MFFFFLWKINKGKHKNTLCSFIASSSNHVSKLGVNFSLRALTIFLLPYSMNYQPEDRWGKPVPANWSDGFFSFPYYKILFVYWKFSAPDFKWIKNPYHPTRFQCNVSSFLVSEIVYTTVVLYKFNYLQYVLYCEQNLRKHFHHPSKSSIG